MRVPGGAVRGSRWMLAGALLGCLGPPAPDAAVCQDLIARVCRVPACASLPSRGADCEGPLLVRTGCAEEAFQFSEPTRERVLTCRAELGSLPSCLEATSTLEACPEVKRFLFGATR